jgi:hypothetical protein
MADADAMLIRKLKVAALEGGEALSLSVVVARARGMPPATGSKISPARATKSRLALTIRSDRGWLVTSPSKQATRAIGLPRTSERSRVLGRSSVLAQDRRGRETNRRSAAPPASCGADDQ